MAGNTYKLVISILGDYTGWSEVLYKYPKKKGGEDENYTTVKSKSLLKAIFKEENPDRLIIFTLDSLCVNLKNFSSFESYKEILTHVKEDVYNFIQKHVLDSEDVDINELEERFKVYILPSKGKFKSRNAPRMLMVEGQMADAKYFMYYFLVKDILYILRNDLHNNIKRFEVVIDISHGMNYIPAYLMENILKALGILKVFKNKDFIRLKILYSDPFVPGVPPDKQILEINDLYSGKGSYPIDLYYPDERINGNLLDVYYSNKSFKLDNEIIKAMDIDEKNRLKDEVNSLINKFGDVFEDVNIFLEGVRRGLPLIAFHFNPEPERLEKHINDIITKYCSRIEIKRSELNGNDTIIILRKLMLMEEFNVFVSSLLYSYIIKKIFEPHKRDRWVDLKGIIDFRNKLYPGRNRDARWILINKEISKTKNNVEKVLKRSKRSNSKSVNDITLYNFLFKHLKNYNLPWMFEGEGEQDWKRNFYAHAGFHIGIVKIRFDDSGSIQLCYRLREKIFIYNGKIFHDINYVLDRDLQDNIVNKGKAICVEELIRNVLK